MEWYFLPRYSSMSASFWRISSAKPLQRPAHCGELFLLGDDLGDLLLRSRSHLLARHTTRVAQPEERLHLAQREAEGLSVLDEAHEPHALAVVAPVSVRLPLRRAQQTPSLVVAERLDVDPRRSGHLPDQQAAVFIHGRQATPRTMVQGQEGCRHLPTTSNGWG